MTEKQPKAAVQYGEGMRSARCGLCEHFERPNRCELVEGIIYPRDWCKLFERIERT